MLLQHPYETHAHTSETTETLETYACNMRFQHNVTLLLRRMELIVVELDVGAELDATERAEVASVELIGSTNLNSGRDRHMECGRDGRRESGRGARGAGEGGVGEWCRRSPSERGRHGKAESVSPTCDT